ncbi:MAG: class I SAM-dependent methyltransferase [Nitrospirae bacterium]|uniref:class I SAM-dependent methyltransferase n=1 Tax=Candidatus Magnetobacterium casense TaxID=1455061 RepID=UPI0005916249|nr:class I SAM-dependent methyltransferase [Candidatus Magnetobacterium casensis]MBF0336976.1 class I SAM-dependent methyltransferase [Nitrospirota bacterium]
MIDDLIDSFEATVTRANSHEAGRPRVHTTIMESVDVVWGSDLHGMQYDPLKDIYIQQGVREFTTVLGMIEAMKNRSVGLETGFFRGGAHLLFREFFDKFVSVELNPAHLIKYLQNNVLDDRSELIIGPSVAPSTLDKVREVTNGELDFIMLDGDHSYEGVKSDFLAYWPMLRDNGILAIHDSSCPHVRVIKDVYQFVQELKQLHFNIDLVHIDYCGIAIIRKDEQNRNIKLPENKYMTSLDALPPNARLCLYGSGNFGRRMRNNIAIQRKDIEVRFFADSFKDGQEGNLKVINVNNLKEHMAEIDMVLVTSMYSRDIETILGNHGISNYKIAMSFL